MSEIVMWALVVPAACLVQAVIIALVMQWAYDKEDD
jgi:hypothetical protein